MGSRNENVGSKNLNKPPPQRCNHLIATNAPVTKMKMRILPFFICSVHFLIVGFICHQVLRTHTDTWPRYQSKRKEEESIICAKSIRLEGQSIFTLSPLFTCLLWDHHLMELITLMLFLRQSVGWRSCYCFSTSGGFKTTLINRSLLRFEEGRRWSSG